MVKRPDPDDRAAHVYPCRFCGYRFNHELLGPYGCPNCLGDGLDDNEDADDDYESPERDRPDPGADD